MNDFNIIIDKMTDKAITRYKIFLEKENSRFQGESSSKTGRDYEDLASFYILERFDKITKKRSKIKGFFFNGLEDLDIIDDTDRIYLFQIKKIKSIWQKSSPKLTTFIVRSISRAINLQREKSPLVLFQYFFTNKMGEFLEEWKLLHKTEPDKLYNMLTRQSKESLKKEGFSIKEIVATFSNIYFFTGQQIYFLKVLIDLGLLKKFKEFKDKQAIGEFIKIIEYNELIFHEKRLAFSIIENPAFEKDILISNTINIELNKDRIFSANHRKGLMKSDLDDEFRKKNLSIAFLMKYGKIYSFQDFNNRNPLSKYIEFSSKIKVIRIEQLKIKDQINFLNDWLDKYLRFLGLEFFRKKNISYYYFQKYSKNKVIDWYDPKAQKIKEWTVVEFRQTHYKNVAANIRFKKLKDKFLIFIIPRLTFTSDGKELLKQHDIRSIERKYRKPFMKNDFLRRSFHMWVSFIKNDIERYKSKKKQTSIISSISSTESEKMNKKLRFFDLKVMKLKDVVELEASFKPNNESRQEKDISQKTII